MLILMCAAGKVRCAIDSASAIEVLPIVRLEPLPGSSPPIAGIARHRGLSLIVIDMVSALMNQTCLNRWSGRIVVVESSALPRQRFGLMVENAEPKPLAGVPKEAEVGQGAWGRFCQDDEGVYQLLDIDFIRERLLTHPAQQAQAAGCP